MIDIYTIRDSGFREVNILNVAYKFRNMPYLVADKFSNFFMIEHCPNKRTIPFKHLENKGYINYHGNKIRISILRNRAIKTNYKIQICHIKLNYL